MTTDQQVKQILEIFNGLDHEQQVDVFVQVRAQLIQMRNAQLEEFSAQYERTAKAIEVMKSGNIEISPKG